ncbi:unnamed protein product [marine sediment metagenome]|uniref:Uncharacterized protein n=1 Tax=marine sediment metagenome TaxID=412755 RepID=X0VRU5_9ZZZZ
MPEKRMLIVEADAVRKIDENRGDMSVSDFISFLIDSQLKQDVNGQSNDHITKEEFCQFEQGIRELLRNFLEFFLSYGLELGKEPTDKEFDALTKKLQVLGVSAKAKSS